MAIKRTAKSPGTPVRKSVPSPGLRHVDVLLPHQMAAADLYSGWICKNKACGLVIAIEPVQAAAKPGSPASEDQLAALKCPHCGNEDLYRWSARGEHRYAPASLAK